MNEKQQAEQARLLAEAAVNALEDKKGMDVRLLPVGEQTAWNIVSSRSLGLTPLTSRATATTSGS